MQFKVLLDTYTVDQQEFIKKYDSASDNEKAGYDINKFFDAINANDYTYAYNCLAESFKQNNFTRIIILFNKFPYMLSNYFPLSIFSNVLHKSLQYARSLPISWPQYIFSFR